MTDHTMIPMSERYGVWGLISLGMDWLYTRLFFPKARIVRHPIHIRGRRYIDYGTQLTTGRYCRMDAFPTSETSKAILQIGSSVQINDFVHIAAVQSVKIHDHVLIASKVFISDHNHGYYGPDYPNSNPDSIPSERPLSSAAIVIEERAWIGEGVAILPGVTIGSGSIIGLNSVVCHSIPPYCIAAGVPARVIKKFNSASKIWERV